MMTKEQKYTIVTIAEDDYGCEARPDDYVPMVQVQIRAMEPDDFGEYEQTWIAMEDALLYTRDLDEGDEAVIGYDGTLFPPGMLCNEVEEEPEKLGDCAQEVWMNNYMEAVEELDSI